MTDIYIHHVVDINIGHEMVAKIPPSPDVVRGIFVYPDSRAILLSIAFSKMQQ